MSLYSLILLFLLQYQFSIYVHNETAVSKITLTQGSSNITCVIFNKGCINLLQKNRTFLSDNNLSLAVHWLLLEKNRLIILQCFLKHFDKYMIEKTEESIKNGQPTKQTTQETDNPQNRQHKKQTTHKTDNTRNRQPTKQTTQETDNPQNRQHKKQTTHKTDNTRNRQPTKQTTQETDNPQNRQHKKQTTHKTDNTRNRQPTKSQKTEKNYPTK